MARPVDRPLAEDRARALALTPVSHETLARLDRYVELLLAFQTHTNLIAPSTVPTLWTRHVADSLQLLDLAPGATTWIDLGSGGGFPGIVLACALAERPGATVHLVESTKKKATFLQETARQLAIPAEIHPVRIEDFVKNYPGAADVVTARALAPLQMLLTLAGPLLGKGAQGLFLKGQDIASELTEASKYWTLDAELIPSKTHPDARIVAVRHASAKGPRGRGSRG